MFTQWNARPVCRAASEGHRQVTIHRKASRCIRDYPLQIQLRVDPTSSDERQRRDRQENVPLAGQALDRISFMKALVILLLLAPPLDAQVRPVHTYSIVARDAETGEIGVAVQSHWFAVGQIVPWAEAGVGAVATQSFVDPSYGPLGLDLLRAGRSAPDSLRGLLVADGACQVRQVAMIDASGRVATFTGGDNIESAGGLAGDGKASTIACGSSGGTITVGTEFAVQANLMASDEVWPAMESAYNSTEGDLAERLLAALDAAQSAGGDIRGKQSAALIVVSGTPSGKAWQDELFHVRVDDASDPLGELRRLVALQRAYNHMNAGDLAVEHGDAERALREYAAAERIAATTRGVPTSRHAEMIYWTAVSLVNMQRVEEALPLFARAFEMQPSWRELTPRLPASGLLPDDADLIRRIVEARR